MESDRKAYRCFSVPIHILELLSQTTDSALSNNPVLIDDAFDSSMENRHRPESVASQIVSSSPKCPQLIFVVPRLPFRISSVLPVPRRKISKLSCSHVPRSSFPMTSILLVAFGLPGFWILTHLPVFLSNLYIRLLIISRFPSFSLARLTARHASGS